MSYSAFWRRSVIALTFAAVCHFSYAADVTARIKGTIVDSTGAALPNVTVTATNESTGVKFTTKSSGSGDYLFQALPIGTYDIAVAPGGGFKGFEAKGIILNIDQEFIETVQLTVGTGGDSIEVQADAVQVNTTDMQLNNIVDAHQITELPLIGRGFTQLEQILPGVQASSDRFGSFSVNGSQTQQSSYIINGADSNDLPLNTVAISPNIDTLQEFNLVTGPLNAEYDRNGGAIVTTAIKEGTNHFHGDAFEFYRDTFLNTRNFFQKAAPTPTFHQNIFGGTVGGPVLKDKLFFFGGYQGTRQVVPEAGGTATVFSAAQLAGDFSNATLTNTPIPATITVPGCTSGVTTYAQCFPGGKVPTTAFNPIAVALTKQYIPAANNGVNGYTFVATAPTKSDQEIFRVDFNPTAKNQIYFVGIFQKTATTETLPFTGATVPGFGDMNTTNIHQFSAGFTRQLSASLLNNLEVHFTRFNFDAVEPQHVVTPASLGFAITPQNAAAASVPTISINGADSTQAALTLGFSTNGPQPRIDQVYQVDDSVSKTLGHHSLKFGYDGRKYTVHNPFYNSNSGSFNFTTASNPDTTGDAGLDFLLGVPFSYNQGSGAIIQAYAFLNYFYAQDTWKATNALTLSYGLGYQIDTPLHNQQYGNIGVTCYVPGQQSKVFTSAPIGLSYPGDPGCNNASGATTNYKDFGPRIGFAYAPNLGFLSGGDAKKLSIRAGYGIYYNRTEEETSLQNLADAPFGINSGGATDYGVATNPSFANPYQDLNVAGPAGLYKSKFPFVAPAAGSKPDFSTFVPLSLSQYAPGFRSPYSENYQLTVEREFPQQAVLRVSYVGTLGRHNQTEVEGNPISPAGHAACLASASCIANRNNQNFYYPNHTTYPQADTSNFGTGPSGVGYNLIPSIGLISTSTSSNYNSLQVSVDKGLTHGLQMQASYTLSHALDNGSSFENTGFGGSRGYNQYQPSLNYGNSQYDARHRFVIAPVYTVPTSKSGSSFSPRNLALAGWEITGIATFATGQPFDIAYNGATSRSLWCSANWSYYACPDVPQQTAPIVLANQRQHIIVGGQAANKTAYFTGGATGSFAAEPLGSFGNISRFKYHGPGINNTNLIIGKNIPVSSDGTRYLQLRIESDNVFNHTQFSNPSGSYTSANFGLITAAAAGRQSQLGAKFYF
jgi:hypothetical protein